MGDSPTPDLESLIKLHKRSQLFVGVHNEALTIAPVSPKSFTLTRPFEAAFESGW
jgi:hypothetical protein